MWKMMKIVEKDRKKDQFWKIWSKSNAEKVNQNKPKTHKVWKNKKKSINFEKWIMKYDKQRKQRVTMKKRISEYVKKAEKCGKRKQRIILKKLKHKTWKKN